MAETPTPEAPPAPDAEAPAPEAPAPEAAAPQPTPSRAPLSPHNFARLVLVLVGSVWGSIGLWALANPQSLADAADFQLMSPTAFGEIRAMYGGLGVALGLVHIGAAVRQMWLKPALLTATALLIGLLTGRISGVVLDGFPTPTGLLLLFAEFVLVGLSAFALFRFLGRK